MMSSASDDVEITLALSHSAPSCVDRDSIAEGCRLGLRLLMLFSLGLVGGAVGFCGPAAVAPPAVVSSSRRENSPTVIWPSASMSKIRARAARSDSGTPGRSCAAAAIRSAGWITRLSALPLAVASFSSDLKRLRVAVL
jgi:hypothetical protein